MLNPFVPATPGDEAKARQLVETLGAFFVQEVRQRRKLDDSVAIDSGEVWTAAGKGKKFANVDDLMADLHADD